MTTAAPTPLTEAELDELERRCAPREILTLQGRCDDRSVARLIAEVRASRALAAEARLGRPLIAPAGLGRITTALARLLHATYLDGPPDEATCDEWRDVVAAAKSEYDGLLRRLADAEARLAQAPGDEFVEKWADAICHFIPGKSPTSSDLVRALLADLPRPPAEARPLTVLTAIALPEVRSGSRVACAETQWAKLQWRRRNDRWEIRVLHKRRSRPLDETAAMLPERWMPWSTMDMLYHEHFDLECVLVDAKEGR